jgi:hypothetical protein
MSLVKQTKLALDDSRILMLGAQILLGFQLHSPFREAFDRLAHYQKTMELVALCLMVVVIGLIVMPSARHRIVDGGKATADINRFITRMSALTLLPFAIAVGLDLAIAGIQIAGLWPGIAFGMFSTAAALTLWYGPAFNGSKEPSAMPRTEKTPITEKVDYILTEARVVLPGVQALLGFQLAITFTSAFSELESSAKLTHGAALACIAFAGMLLIAPAAYHRIVCKGEASAAYYDTASRFILAATIFLALGLALDLHVVVGKITENQTLAGIIAAATALMLFGLWHGYPLWRRMRNQSGAHGVAST